MNELILSETSFDGPSSGWDWPSVPPSWLQVTSEGCLLSPNKGEQASLSGSGVHTRNGDSIELVYALKEAGRGSLSLSYTGGAEHAAVSLDFANQRLTLSTSDWTIPQPVVDLSLRMQDTDCHSLLIEKAAGSGELVKRCDIAIYVDGLHVATCPDLNVLPEIGVSVTVRDTSIRLQHFYHRGTPSAIPEFLHVGAWQMLNEPSIEHNLNSIKRGLRQAAERGVQLLVTPETSLTGLYPINKVTQNREAISEAERDLRQFLGQLDNAPYLVVGLPVWEACPEHTRKATRHNVSRLYDPDGGIVSSHAKIHSCETEFWHGYQLQEFDVYGVPVTMHICHDGRYPEVWTLPVIFGARLILHPSNPVDKANHIETIDRFEGRANGDTSTSHAFYVKVTGAGGSHISGPQKHNNLLAVSQDYRRDNPAFPFCGPVVEDLVHTRIRVPDAFGYWPVRSYRASEEIASAYRSLYEAWGGLR